MESLMNARKKFRRTSKKINKYARAEVPQRPKEYPFTSNALIAVSLFITYGVARHEFFNIMIPVQYIFAQVFTGAMTIATFSILSYVIYNFSKKIRKVFYGDMRYGSRKMNPWISLILVVGLGYFFYLFNCFIYAAEANEGIFFAALLGFIIIWTAVNGMGAVLKIGKSYEAFKPNDKEGYLTTWRAVLLTLAVAAVHIIYIVIVKLLIENGTIPI